MKESKDIRGELKHMDSSLQEMNIKYKYEVTEGFFDEVQGNVIHSLEANKSIKRKIGFSKWLMASAAFIVIVLGSFWVIKYGQLSELKLDNLSHEQIYAYLTDEYYLNNIQTEELLDYLDEDDSWTFEENLDVDGAEYYLEDNLFEFSLEELNDF